MNMHAVSPYPTMALAIAPSTPVPAHSILIVDDDTAILSVSARFLTRSGYNVDTAEDGLDGWKAINAKKYDLLITDHDMPGLTGVELVKKTRLARMSLPVVLVSGVFPSEDVQRHPWLHLAATLLKPFSLDQLLNTVKGVFLAASIHPDGIVISRDTMTNHHPKLRNTGGE